MIPESNWHLEIKANWPRLSAILFLRLETLQLTLLSKKNFLSNCSKQLVTPVNLTRIFFLTNYVISRAGSELPKLKTAFYESHFPHCVMIWIFIQSEGDEIKSKLDFKRDRTLMRYTTQSFRIIFSIRSKILISKLSTLETLMLLFVFRCLITLRVIFSC